MLSPITRLDTLSMPVHATVRLAGRVQTAKYPYHLVLFGQLDFRRSHDFVTPHGCICTTRMTVMSTPSAFRLGQVHTTACAYLAPQGLAKIVSTTTSVHLCPVRMGVSAQVGCQFAQAAAPAASAGRLVSRGKDGAGFKEHALVRRQDEEADDDHE